MNETQTTYTKNYVFQHTQLCTHTPQLYEGCTIVYPYIRMKGTKTRHYPPICTVPSHLKLNVWVLNPVHCPAGDLLRVRLSHDCWLAAGLAGGCLSLYRRLRVITQMIYGAHLPACPNRLSSAQLVNPPYTQTHTHTHTHLAASHSDEFLTEVILTRSPWRRQPPAGSHAEMWLHCLRGHPPHSCAQGPRNRQGRAVHSLAEDFD